MDESRNITLTIAGKTNSLKAPNAEAERLMRLAADEINQKLADYGSKYADISLDQKLAFVALSETFGRLSAVSRLSKLKNEIDGLHGELDSYLCKEENK